jgi:hypothetical protein
MIVSAKIACDWPSAAVFFLLVPMPSFVPGQSFASAMPNHLASDRHDLPVERSDGCARKAYGVNGKRTEMKRNKPGSEFEFQLDRLKRNAMFIAL